MVKNDLGVSMSLGVNGDLTLHRHGNRAFSKSSASFAE